uniref:Uncharacterized protein n=1 Tax=Timema douglasi TaxID=61478 RepID=A0A7R8VPH2_TIMDO|nr:unnamed protein product [Timema douglasi]
MTSALANYTTEAELCHAATKIQASFRGHMARKQVDEPTKGKPEDELSKELQKLDAKQSSFNTTSALANYATETGRCKGIVPTFAGRQSGKTTLGTPDWYSNPVIPVISNSTFWTRFCVKAHFTSVTYNFNPFPFTYPRPLGERSIVIIRVTWRSRGTVNDDPQNVFPSLDGLVGCLLLTVVCSSAVLQDVEIVCHVELEPAMTSPRGSYCLSAPGPHVMSELRLILRANVFLNLCVDLALRVLSVTQRIECTAILGERADEEELDIDLSDPDLHKAATKIQASFRGHKVRKETEGQ